MTDKYLTEGEWKKAAKGRDLKDAAFVKALAALDKAKTPEDQLKALEIIGKEAEVLRKAAKGDKDLLAHLDNVTKAVAKEEKLAKDASKKEEEGDEDEEEDSPVLLTTKMVPLLRQVKKGAEMQVLVANVGKDAAVLMSRRAISPARRKLLIEYLKGTGTPKFLPGTCIFEENAYTFVLQTQAGGLAKKLKAALLKQVELRLKVRVRGEDPNDIDDDGDPDEGDEGQDNEGQDNEGQGTQGEESDTGNVPPPPPPPPPDPLKAQFEKRWLDLGNRVLENLRKGVGDVSKQRAVADFVMEKGEAGNYKAALAGMDSLEKLLGTTAPPPPTPPKTDDAATAFTARLTALMPSAKTAIAAGGDEGTDIKLKISEAGVFARKKDFEQANALLDEAEELIGKSSDPDQTGSKTDPKEEEQDEGQQEGDQPQGGTATGMEAALKEWRAVRDRTVARLKALVKEMADEKAPEARDAIIEVSAVFKQLGGDPRTAQQVAEMRKWLQEDDVVDDVCEMEEDIRGPLLDALEGVQQVLETA